MKKLLLSPLASPCSRYPLRRAADAVRRACAGRDAVTHRLHPLLSAHATLRAFVTMGRKMGRHPAGPSSCPAFPSFRRGKRKGPLEAGDPVPAGKPRLLTDVP